MGNSGSVHHMQSGLKELHTYYQVQSNDDNGATGGDGCSFLKDEQQFSEKSNPLMQTSSNRLNGLTPVTTKTSGANISHHIKVLPNLSENLRLRSTTNGAILHSGGTISGRKESLLSQPPPLMVRSRTFIAENSENCMNMNVEAASLMTMQRRSQTQLDIDLKKRYPNKLLDENLSHKRFSSNFYLRRPLATNENVDTCQKMSKAKIRTKKRKAPSVPPPSSDILPIIIDQNNDLERKQRLFKTKTETNANYSSRHQPVKRSQRIGELPEVMMRSKLSPVFRREKSFDAKLLLSETRNSKYLQRELKPAILDVKTKRNSLQIERTTTPSSLSISPCQVINNKLEKTDLKMEVTVATKPRYHSIVKTTEPLARQRDTNEEQRKFVAPLSRANKIDSQSKIPQLKRTFYFGMESSKRKTLTTTKMNDSSRNVGNPSEMLNDTIIPTNHSSSKDHDKMSSLNHKYGSHVINDNGIQLHVRPILPRRQLEIPRFSPVAAWRTLSVADDYRKEQHPNSTNSSTSQIAPSLNTAIETANTVIIEDRIHLTYRDPCPFYSDNKSGDSGISGDNGYIVEKPIQLQNLQHFQNNCFHELPNFDSSSPVDELEAPPIKFLAAWTPQHDLGDEEDSSSDGVADEMALNISKAFTPKSQHVFSLSLPRENQLAVYEEKNKLDFRSLQKIKSTTSGDLNNINGGCNSQSSADPHQNIYGEKDVVMGNHFRSGDNWVLSKTAGMTAISTHLTNDPKNIVHQMDTLKNIVDGNTYFDLSGSLQPISLGSLATGKHVMYLPNQTTGSGIRLPTSRNVLNKYENSLEDLFCKNTPMLNKRFGFQSSVHQIELPKEADQNEARHKIELEAMRRVEEEFQRKRACEKASIRQQLRLYSMDDDNFMSLPNLNDYRDEPDGAAASASESSPILKTPTTRRKHL